MLEAVSLYYIKIYELNYITGSHEELEWLMYDTFCIIQQCACEVVAVLWFLLINYVSVLAHFLTVIIVCWGG